MSVEAEVERGELPDSGKRRWTLPEIVVVKEAPDAEIAGGSEDDGGLLFQSPAP